MPICWVHAHAYALALQNLTGVATEKMLPTPNIELSKIPACDNYLAEGEHRLPYRFSPEDYAESAGIWRNGGQALLGDPPGPLEVVGAFLEGGKVPEMTGTDTRAR